jgi:HSP20 family protein
MEMSRWYPFRFRRPQSNGSGRSERSGESGEGSSQEMMTRQMMMREMMRNPMAMMRQMMSEPFFESMPSMLRREMMPEQWFGDFSQPFFEPRVDVVDTGKAVRITAELPGMSRDDVDVEIQEGSLILSGQKKEEHVEEQEGYYRAERSFGSFRRVIPMPEDLNFDKCEARFKDGVLNVTLPKRSNGKSKTSRVEVKG